MARPANKVELLSAADKEFDRLWNAIGSIPEKDRELAGACEAWSVKDLLAHLHAWHQMTLLWEKEGSAGGRPVIPAEGYTFAETPALNAAIFERTKDDPWNDVVSRLRETHAELLAVINTYDDDDLFVKRRYPWTKSTSVGSYMTSATSSHYAWASKLIRRWCKVLSE